jgi:hypothetical protein
MKVQGFRCEKWYYTASRIFIIANLLVSLLIFVPLSTAADPMWGTAEEVSTETINSGVPYATSRPHFAVDANGTIHVVWNENNNYLASGTDYDVLYNHKQVGGTWSTTEVISTESTSDSFIPKVAIGSNGTIHVAWSDETDYLGSGIDGDIFYKYKPAGGNWSTTEVISTESTGHSIRPSLVVASNGTLHVVWEDITNYLGAGTDLDIFYKYKPAGGAWSTTSVVSTESTGTVYDPSLFIDDTNDTLHLTWADNTNYLGSGDDVDIFYKYKPAGGAWSVAEVISTESAYSAGASHPSVDSEGTVHAVYGSITGGTFVSDIYHKYKAVGGSWTTAERISTESTGDSVGCSFWIDSLDAVHVVWSDDTNYLGSGTDSDIFYKYKSAGGNWSTTEVISTGSTREDGYPSIVVETSEYSIIHIVWDVGTLYAGVTRINLDVYYKCGYVCFGISDPTNIAYTIPTGNLTLGITWTKGSNATNTIVVKGTTAYPTMPYNTSDGTVVYNGTGTAYWESSPINTSIPIYLTLFSWNLVCGYTSGVTVPFGAMLINVYNESKPWQRIPFDVIITNRLGTQTVLFSDQMGPVVVNTTDVPYGVNTIFYFTSDGYKQRTYYLDLEMHVFYDLSFYLPPYGTPGPNETFNLRQYIDSTTVDSYAVDKVMTLTFEPETIVSVELYNKSLYGTYGGWYLVPGDQYGNVNKTLTVNVSALDENSTAIKCLYWYKDFNDIESLLYQLNVVNQFGQPINMAKIAVRRYLNTTGTFTPVAILLTDANGQADVYLVPNALYKFFVTKTGYTDGVSDWIPTTQISSHTFLLEYATTPVEPKPNPHKLITFVASFTDNTTLYLRVSDSSGNLTLAYLYIYEDKTLIETLNFTSVPYSYNYTHNASRPNVSAHDYMVRLYVVDHPDFGHYNFTIHIAKRKPQHLLLDIDIGGTVGVSLGAVAGGVGWFNVFLLCLGVFVMVSFGKYWAGVGIIALGLILGLFQLAIGLPGFDGVQVLSFICFCLVYGTLVELAKQKKGRGI